MWVPTHVCILMYIVSSDTSSGVLTVNGEQTNSKDFPGTSENRLTVSAMFMYVWLNFYVHHYKIRDPF